MNEFLTAGRRTIPVAMMIAAPIIIALAGLVGAGDNSALCASQAPVADHVGRFPDFGQLPPPEVFQPERTFKLSQDYPAFQPLVEKPVQDILAIDYTKDWKAYADAVFNYILEGNIHGEGVSNDFYLEDNKVRRWYHVPWQHFGDNGREGIHGLTAEGPEAPLTLGPDQTSKTTWQTYAVGFYNDLGGYTIGRVWADADNPDLTAVQRMGGFPVGTVVGKFLFSTAPVEQVPYLGNAVEWNAYVRPDGLPMTGSPFPIRPRIMSKVRLIQMDFMVRDARADPTGGWVFGTYVYNGLTANPNLWRNLVPVGVMWGNDPEVMSHQEGNPRPTQTLTNPDLKHTVINAGDKMLPPSHLGFGLRLAGPADNTASSCKSCHSVAEFPTISPILPFLATDQNAKTLQPGSPEWMRWFRDLGPTEAFDTDAVSMDNSMQLAASVQNFLIAKSIATGGHFSQQYWRGRPVAPITGQRGLPEPGQ